MDTNNEIGPAGPRMRRIRERLAALPLGLKITLPVAAITAGAVLVVLAGLGGRSGPGAGTMLRDLGVLVLVVATVAFASVAALFSFLVLRPANRLAEAADRLAEGDLTVSVPHRGRRGWDVLNRLGHDLDRMARIVERRVRQQRGVAELAQSALAGMDRQELLERACLVVAEGLSCEMAAIVVPAPDGLRLEAMFGWDPSLRGTAVPETSHSGYTLATGGPVLSEDLSAETRFEPSDLLLEAGVRSAASVVIPGQRGPLGALSGHTRRPRRFTVDDIHFLRSVAGVLGSAVIQRDAQQEMASAEIRFRTLVERIPAVAYIAGFGKEGRWEYVAPQIERVLGYTPQEWTADPNLWARRIHPDDLERVLADEERSRNTLKPLALEYRLGTRDGRWVWVRDDAVVIRNDRGEPLHFQGVLYDITEQKIAHDALRQALEREEQAVQRLSSLDEMKNAFLSAVSHELRTPLASVLGYAVTLQEAEEAALVPGEREELVGRLVINARKLDRLLSDLLDVDRLSRGLIEPNRMETDLRALVDRVVGETDLGDHPVEIDVQPMRAWLDGPKVERILENLLVNATRYTPRGTPVVVRAGQSPTGVLLSVEDRGPGVPDEMKDSVFYPFDRGAREVGHAPGAGIGLALVARFAQLHGGSAWVEDRAGGGASFRVLLPTSKLRIVADAPGGSAVDLTPARARPHPASEEGR